MNKIFFDTNVLTGLYAYSLNTFHTIVSTLEKLCDEETTIVIPATVKEEYDRHFHQSRSRTGDKYPVAVFRKYFNSHKQKIIDVCEKIQPFRLSNIFETDIDKNIDQFRQDVQSFLQIIDRDLTTLENKYNKDLINDENDDLLVFVKNHCLQELTISEKIEMAAKAEIRFTNKIRPGLTDKNKNDYKFQKYGDVFIWYEIIKNSKDGDKIIFVTNEKKDDWWEDNGCNKVAYELEEELKGIFADVEFEILQFNDFYTKFLETEMDNEEAKIEVNQLRNKLDEYISKGDYISNLENELYDCISLEELEDCLVGESVAGGNISEIFDIQINKISVDKKTASPCYDSSDATINDCCKVNVFVDCIAVSEYDSESIPSNVELKLCFNFEVKYFYNIIINQKEISSLFNDEVHKLIDYMIINEKNLTYGYDDEIEVGIYGNCTNCSEPINEENYGDGTLCYNCMIQQMDD